MASHLDQPIVVIFSMSVEAKKGIEPPPRGRVGPVAVPEVPLAHCVGPVSPLLQNLVRHKQQLIGRKSLDSPPVTTRPIVSRHGDME